MERHHLRRGASAASKGRNNGRRLRASLKCLGLLFLTLASAAGLTWPQLPASAQQQGQATQPAGRNAGVRAKRTPPPRGAQSRAAGDAAKSSDAKTTRAISTEAKTQSTLALQGYSPVLATADFDLIGLAVAAGPATQTVPKNTPTSILTSLQLPDGADPTLALAGVNPNYRVRGELVGPSLSSPLTVEAAVGQPLRLPALTAAGDHLVQNLRVVDTGAPGQPSVAPVAPDACGVSVIDRLLVSEVQVRELTHEQIIQAGINISDDSYTYFNFTLGLGTTSTGQSIEIPVAFPGVGVPDPRPIIGLPSTISPGVGLPPPVPDVLPVMLELERLPEGLDLDDVGGPVRIPGVVVFPGRIGLLHQFFEATVIVANGAPGGTPLVVRSLRARVKLPDAGTPGVESDDPLRIAETQAAGRVTEMELHGLGADGKYGTADDSTRFAPGESGQGSFLVEGLKEGLHTINFDLEGTLEGLPGGPVTVRGEVPGAVVVRDASFGVTFTHPSVVRAGQEYELGMTLYNTGQRDIQGAFSELARNQISGAELLGTEIRRQFGPVGRGDSATVKWRLRANTTGAVTASYVKLAAGIESGLALATGVGDRNVPLSPDSLILPDTVNNLPPDAVEAARGLLGQAWSIANAPPGALPEGVTAVDKKTVIDRAVELGIAGLRVGFGEQADVSLATLMRDWLGELQESPDAGFADALRDTDAGLRWYDSVGREWHRRLSAGASPEELLTNLARAEQPRSPFVAALVSQPQGGTLASARLVAPGGLAVGFGPEVGERSGGLRTGASVRLDAPGAGGGAETSFGQLLLASEPSGETWALELVGRAEGRVNVSLVVPAGAGTYRRLVFNDVPVAPGTAHRVTFRPSGSGAVSLEEFRVGAFIQTGVSATTAETLNEPEPRVVGVVQVTPDVLAGGDKYGRIVGLLFSKPMAKTTAETKSRYAVGGGALAGASQAEPVGGPVSVLGARLDYGDRFVFLSLDTPVGPFIERDVTAAGLTDRRGLALAAAKTPVSMRVSPEGVPPGAYLTGRVVGADGTPVAGAKVIYWTQECDPGTDLFRAGGPKPLAQRLTDAQGRYAFDYVRNGDCGPLIVTVLNPVTQSEKRLTTPVAYHGQHMVLDMVFLARGNVEGTVVSGGRPLARAVVQVVPTLDALAAKVVQTDANGHYAVGDIPVGNVSVVAVGTGTASNASGIAAGTIDGPGRTAFINVSLQNVSGAVRGRVVNPDQSPAPGALVVAYAQIPGFQNNERGDAQTPVGYTYADREGRFALENLPVGDIKLEVVDYVTRATVTRTVQLRDAAPEVNDVLIVVAGSGTVAGRVVDETGAFVPDAVVVGAGRGVKAGPLGDYTLQNMPAGTHRLTAYDPATGMTGEVSVEVRLGQTSAGINIPILRPATITGRVLLQQGGAAAPVKGVAVTTDGYHKFLTDEQGRYTVRNVQPNAALTLRFVEVSKNLVINMPVVVSPGESLVRDVTLRPGSVRGRITQPDGVTGTAAFVKIYAPVPNLTEGEHWGKVRSDRPLSTQSDGSGAYSLAGVNPGAYRVTTSNSFFPTPVSGGGSLAPGGEEECNLSLVNTLAGKIQGAVLRPDGTTPAGAGIEVTLGGGSLADVTVRTDEAGRYEFAEVFAAGTYNLTATDPATGQTNRVRVSVQKNQDVIADVRLRGTGALRVKVIDGAGDPVPDGQVTLAGAEYPNARRYAELTPGHAGTFPFENLPEGEYAVSATRNGLGGRASVSAVTGTTVEVVVQLQASGTVKGRALMPDGVTALGLADVELKIGGRSAGFTVTSDADADRGSFTFLNVPAGQFTLDVLDNRTGRVGRATGQIAAQGETATVDVKLLPVGAVAGQVTANGQPVDHALVELFANGSGVRSERLKATTDEEGRFRFTGVPVGSFQISVTGAPGGQTGSASGYVAGTVEPLPDTVVNIVLEPSVTVTGTVYRSGGGAQPLSGARVRINVGSRRYETTTSEAGVYRLGYVPLGELRVRAEAPSGYDRGEAAAITASTPGETVTADVQMAGTGNVSGRALDSNGAPLATGTVTFTNDAWRDVPVTIAAPVQADGRYEVAGAPAGAFALRLTVPNRIGVGSAAAELAGGQSLPLDVRLEDAGQVTGRVKTVDGATPAVGVDVTLNLSTPSGKSLRLYAHTDTQGVWRVANVPLGRVSAEVFDNTTGGVGRYAAADLNANAQQLDLGELSLDNTAVRVESITPANGAVGVSPTEPHISVNFSEAVDASTVNGGTVRLMRGNSQVGASVTLAPDRLNATLTPSGRLADSTAYTVVVTTGVADPAGNALRSEVRSTFTTSDVTAPQVQSVSPASGATGVPLASNISITFNEALDASQDLAALFKLAPGDAPAQAVAGALTLDETGRTLTFDPASDLEENTAYTATVSGQRDAAGNVQATAYGWSFKSFVTPGQGTVAVTVLNGLGQPLAGAEVTLTGGNGPVNATTGIDGRSVFKAVPLGAVTVVARDPALGLRGRASGTLSFAGQTLNLSATTVASGVVTGRVFRHDGTTPVAAAEVRVRAGSGQVVAQTTTGADGGYTADFVPVGSFNVEVFDPSTEDRGLVSNQLSSNGETRTINVTLNGLGLVKVVVRDASDRPVAGAQVSLSSQTTFGGTQTSTSGADGVSTFEKVLAGAFSASATDPATQLSGTKGGTVAPGGSAEVVVTLRPAGTIQGRVFSPDGTTGAAGATVRLRLDGWFTDFETKTASDGAYRFAVVPTGNYVVDVFDASNRLRARSGAANVTQNGEVVTRDLTLAGVGTVTGRVLRPDNTVVPNQSISLRSNAPNLGGFYSAKTDAQGVYRVAGVLVGPFTASATVAGQQLQGEVTKQVTRDGEEVTADIKLISNAVGLPVHRWDGNNLYYKVRGDGSIGDGSHGVYGYDGESAAGAFKLSLVSGGAELSFTGANIGSVSQGGRAFSVRQAGLAGLDVTRKVFVPGDGYFARFVELLSNPTAAPVTVDVRVVSNHRDMWWAGSPRIVGTSSGDNTLNVVSASAPDQWVMVDDNTDGDPFQVNSVPTTAFVFDGAGAAEKVDAASFGATAVGRLTYEWRQVTIQPGQTVAYMHFGVQQLRQEAARVAATRLAQLPPEALVGLSAEEMAAVRNFAVPADGTGTVVPLPPLDGAVSGRLLASDGTTPVPNSQVILKSKNPLYGRSYSVFADETGAFSIASYYSSGSDPITIPADAYTLTARHHITAVSSPATDGAFAAGSRQSSQDVVFSGTAVVRGVVRRHTGALITAGSVRLTRGQPNPLNASVSVGADGSYVITGVAADSLQLTPFMSHAQGTSLTGPTVSIAPPADGVLTADLTLDPTGVVSGTVRTGAGATAANVNVQLSREGGEHFSRSTRTDGSGRYTLPDLPAGAYAVRAYEPATGVPTAAAQVSVTPDQTTAQDFTLPAIGKVSLQVNLANGAPAPGAPVQTQIPGVRYWYENVGNTDSLGRLTINNVPAGGFNLRVLHPSTSLVSASASASVTEPGQVVPVTVTLPGVGGVGGMVRYPTGAPAPGTHIHLLDGQEVVTSTNADSSGRYSFPQVTAGRQLALRVYDPTDGSAKVVPFQVDGDGQSLALDVTLPARAAVRVTARYQNGSPLTGASVELRYPNTTNFIWVGYTNSSGVLLIQNVPEGAFAVRVTRDEAAPLTADGAVRQADHGGTVDVTLTAPNAGNIEGLVRAGDGQTLIAYTSVQVYNAATGAYITGTQTNGEGFYRLENVKPVAGGYRVKAYSHAGATTTDYVVQFNEARDAIQLDHVVPVAVIKGRVTYHDGTPVQNLWVGGQHTDSKGDDYYWSYQTADDDGNYLLIGEAKGKVVRVTAEGSGNLMAFAMAASEDVSVPLVVNLVLPPTGVITGTLRDASNNLVADGEVMLRAADAYYNRYAYTDQQGVYRFEQVPVGAFSVRGESSDNWGVAAFGRGSIPGHGQVVTVDLTLPALGTVTGTVRDASGNPVPSLNVSITGSGLADYRTQTTDAQGVYRFESVGVGSFEVQTRKSGTPQLYGTAAGTLEAGQTATADITLGAVATVRGRVSYPDGTPAGNARVRIDNYDHMGARGFHSQTVTADASGNYEATTVQGGNVRVYANDPSDTRRQGIADAAAPAGAATVVDLTIGNGFNVWDYYYDLVGADGFKYDVDCTGELSTGGKADGSLLYAYNDAYELVVNDLNYPCMPGTLLGSEGREASFPVVNMSGLKVARELYSPAGGGFTRYLETFTNQSAAPVTATVVVSSYLGSFETTQLPVSPAQTGNKFAVTGRLGDCCTPAVAHVFDGVGSQVSPEALYGNGRGYVYYRWVLTVPPGASVSLMHFTAQRATDDVAGARAQAEALVNLTDPHMLDGMTAEEKARVVNFNIPRN